jgi:hypothetical protein
MSETQGAPAPPPELSEADDRLAGAEATKRLCRHFEAVLQRMPKSDPERASLEMAVAQLRSAASWLRPLATVPVAPAERRLPETIVECDERGRPVGASYEQAPPGGGAASKRKRGRI